ncbi:deoxyribose-phosphate aldolase [Rhodothalassium salexigens]|uniref:deoxyribose-phosphate aldolase n=1 Tax=Rhodothalassium salexigens TaxID=1086 RepID=UPI002D7AB798|nr:deoxyribose-phosphate aldolase [Rhodothalassium salexigens DSM 2132]
MAGVQATRVNAAAVASRITALAAARPVAAAVRPAWLMRAIACTDLTTLAGDDTPGRVRRLCAKARLPLSPEAQTALGAHRPLTTAAVCVYHGLVETAVRALDGTGIAVAAVSTGFPAGLSPLPLRIEEIRASVAAGAREIDVVITRAHALTDNWSALYDEIAAFRDACGDAHMKVILATGELGSPTRVARAALVAMMAGADFVKTSTGMEKVNATLPAALVMMRAIRDYHARTGARVGFKPAGGIGSADEALAYLVLLREELGPEWMTPARFRFGASRLLGDIERHLDLTLTGRHASPDHFALG